MLGLLLNGRALSRLLPSDQGVARLGAALVAINPFLIGLAGGAATVRLLRAMLYAMSPFDWSVFSGVVFVLTFTAALACALPAWRAARLDPANALRAE